MRSLLVLLFAFLFSLAGAQSQKDIDSLEFLLSRETNDSTKLSLYVELAELYDELNPSENGIQLALDGIALAREIKDDFARAKLLRLRAQLHNELHQSEYNNALDIFNEAQVIQRRIRASYPHKFELNKEIARTYNGIAYLYWQWGKLSESLVYYDSTLKLAAQVWDADTTDIRITRLIGIANNSKGAVLWGLGSYEDAIATYFKAMKFFEKLKMTKFMSLTSSNIGLIYDSWGQKDEALFYFRRSVALGLKSGDPSAIGYALSNMGKFMEMDGMYDSALYFYQRSTAKYSEVNNMGGLGLNMNRLGNIYLKMGNKDRAMNAFNNALTIAKKNDSYYWIAITKQNISKAMLEKQEYNGAIQYANESIELAKAQGFKEIQKDNYLNLSLIYEQLQDYKQAHANYKLFSSLKDSLFSKGKFIQITIMKEQFEAEQRNKENEILRRDQMLHEQRLQRAQTEKYSLTALLFVILVFAVYFLISRGYLKRVNSILIDKNKLVTRQKEEYAEQAEELKKSNEIKNLMFSIVSHDLRGPIHNLDQMVNLLNNDIISKDEFRKHLPIISSNINQISNLTDNLLYWARSQMQGIYVVAKTIDLYDLINEKFPLFKKVAAEKGIEITSEIVKGTQVHADPYMVELIMRNLINNAIKFCSAGNRITLYAKMMNEFTQVTVGDTGIGIPPESMNRIFNDIQFSTRGTHNEKGAGLGLMICKHFIEMNGGKIWVESIYHQGSSFHFTLPNKG